MAMRIFTISKRFPPEERYALIGQIRRSSRSVCMNLREAWAKRRYEAHFVSKLTDADGEQAETCHWLRTAVTCRYLSRADGMSLATEYGHVSGMLNKMMQDPASWCSRYTNR